MLRVGLLVKREIDDAPMSAGWTADFFARSDIKRRTSCTLASTDGGNPITPAMNTNRATGVPTSHGQVMGDSLPTPGSNGIMARRG